MRCKHLLTFRLDLQKELNKQKSINIHLDEEIKMLKARAKYFQKEMSSKSLSKSVKIGDSKYLNNSTKIISEKPFKKKTQHREQTNCYSMNDFQENR